MKVTGFSPITLEVKAPQGDEAWRFSGLPSQLPAEIRPAAIEVVTADVLVSGDQIFTASLPEGVEAVEAPQIAGMFLADGLSALPAEVGPQLQLRVTASPAHPLLLRVRREATGDQEATLGLVHLHVAPGVSLKVEQEVFGSHDGLTHAAVRIHAAPGATVEHVVVVREGANALQIGTWDYRVEAGAKLYQTLLHMGGKHARLQVGVVLAGADAEAHLASLCALTDKAQADLTTRIRHEHADTRSHQLAKNHLDGQSKASFTGRIQIVKDAQRVDARQMNRNLLLSKKAQAVGQPQLEIAADDVKCAHGSSTGQVGDEALFYLLSRGITPARAKELMARAFVEEVFHNTPSPELRQALSKAFRERP